VENYNEKGKGWFWSYLDFCRSVVKDGVVIECVGNERLYQSLKNKEGFIEFKERDFFIKSNNYKNVNLLNFNDCLLTTID